MTTDALHPTGRFVASPIARANLTGDLRGFLAEVLGYEGSVPGEDHEALTRLAQALIINVLDPHLDASYWAGRAAGYGEHHAVSEPTASIDDNETQGAQV